MQKRIDLEEEYWLGQKKIYDELNFVPKEKYYAWQPARWAGNDVAIKLISNYLKDVKSTLEVGAGSAAFSISLFNYNPNISLTAVDISPTAILYGKQIAKDLNVPILFKKCDLFEYSKKADLVLSLGVVEHFTKDKMKKFIKKCINLSNKYIFISIPNQESIFFKNYVQWSNKNSNSYGEKHQKITNDDLIKLLKNEGLDILVTDGFQLFLSEAKFLSEETKNNLEMINILKKAINNFDSKLASEYPNKNFTIDNIQSMSLSELSLSKQVRLKYSFMTFVLAKIK